MIYELSWMMLFSILGYGLRGKWFENGTKTTVIIEIYRRF